MTARKTPAKPLRPTLDVPVRTRPKALLESSPLKVTPTYTTVPPLTFADFETWHNLKHATPTAPSWDATWLVVALMLLACLALGGVVEWLA